MSMQPAAGVPRTAVLAPIQRLYSGKSIRGQHGPRPRSAASEAQQGYGDEEDGEARLQRQIDRQVGVAASGKGTSISSSAGMCKNSVKAVGRHANKGSTELPVTRVEVSRIGSKPNSVVKTGSASRTAEMKVKAPSIQVTKPTPDQLRTMQAAWDAL